MMPKKGRNPRPIKNSRKFTDPKDYDPNYDQVAHQDNRKLSKKELNQRKSVGQLKAMDGAVSDYIAGMTMPAIARKYNVTRRTIQHWIAKRKYDWRQFYAEKYDREVDIRVDELESIKDEAWEAWHASKADATEEIETEGETGDGAFSTRTRKKRSRNGEAAYLGKVIEALSMQCKLRGLLRNSRDEEISENEGEGKRGVQVVEIVVSSKEEADQIYSMEEFKKAKGLEVKVS